MCSRLITLSLLSTIFVFYGVNGEENAFANLATAFMNCLKQFPKILPEEAIKVMKHERNPTTRDEMCMTSCTLKGSGLIVNGKAVMKSFGLVNDIKWSDPGHRKIAMKNSVACKKEYDNVKDECEYAGKLISCYFNKNREDNLPPPTLPSIGR